MRFDHGFDAAHLERLSQVAKGDAMYSTIAEQASAALGMGMMDILEPRWVTGLNAMVDRAAAAAGIGLTKTLADAVTASASSALGMLQLKVDALQHLGSKIAGDEVVECFAPAIT